MFSTKHDIKSLKIGDFGLSIYTERLEQSKCGTLVYNSPEQINGCAYDQSVDIWACGFILYILCSGGKHPIYDKYKMNTEKYTQVIKNFKEYNFPDSFPLYLFIT